MTKDELKHAPFAIDVGAYRERQYITHLQHIIGRRDIDIEVAIRIFQRHIMPRLPEPPHGDFKALDVDEYIENKMRISAEFVGRYISEVRLWHTQTQ